ncbi:MAG: uL15 family ribosomal protein [Nanoarchaeota archaeon]
MKQISKTQVEKRLKKKTNSILVETIIKLKKTNPLVAKILATPKKKSVKINLDRINKESKEGDKILIPGKILSNGELNKKLEIVAWSASEKAIQKIQKSKSNFKEIIEEIKKNPELKNLKILK